MIIFIIVALVALTYYLYTCQATLHYIPTPQNLQILQKCNTIKKAMFYYTPYLFCGIIQAYFASIRQDIDVKLHYKREYIDFGLDYGYFALDWGYYDGKITEAQCDSTDNRVLLVLLSGLTASRTEPYIMNFISNICKSQPDWRIVLYNERLYNNRIYMDPNRQALPQTGFTNIVQDFRRVLQHIRMNHKNSRIYCIGHSFGSNTLLRYLGLCGSNNTDTGILGAVSVGNPYDFQLGLRQLGLSDDYIRKHRQRIVKEKMSQFTPMPKHVKVNLETVYAAKTSYEFDNVFTKFVFGADTVDQHYASINCVNMVEFVKVPTFLLGSYDDPVIVPGMYPEEAIQRNPNIISMMTQVGGHISWFTGLLNPYRWYSKPVIEYIKAISE